MAGMASEVMLPTLVYGKLVIPWTYEAPVILRKWEQQLHASLQAEVDYDVALEVVNVRKRDGFTLLEEVLTVEKDTLLLESRASLVTGGLTYAE